MQFDIHSKCRRKASSFVQEREVLNKNLFIINKKRVGFILSPCGSSKRGITLVHLSSLMGNFMKNSTDFFTACVESVFRNIVIPSRYRCISRIPPGRIRTRNASRNDIRNIRTISPAEVNCCNEYVDNTLHYEAVYQQGLKGARIRHGSAVSRSSSSSTFLLLPIRDCSVCICAPPGPIHQIHYVYAGYI